MSGATHSAAGDLAFARAALSLAWPDARRSGSALHCEIAMGEGVYVIHASCEPGWIALRAEGLPDVESSQALGWSAGLAGGAKFARAARGELEVRAELALDCEAPVAMRLRAARAGIGEALRRVAIAADPPSCARPPFDAGVSPDLVRAARDAGFVVHERPAGRCAVELGAAGATAVAEVAGSASGDGVAACALLVERKQLDRASRAGLLRLLLRSNAAFRQVRASFVETEPTTRAQLEVVFDSAPAAGEWRAALSALAIAARHTRREATALADDPALARWYLGSKRATTAPRVRRLQLETPDVVRPWRPNAPA